MNESRIVALVTHLFVQTPKLGQPVDNCETRQDPCEQQHLAQHRQLIMTCTLGVYNKPQCDTDILFSQWPT